MRDAGSTSPNLTSDSALVVDRVTKVFDGRQGRVTVFDGLSLAVRAGEFLGVIGPTGCGKTTLLNMLAGLDRPTEGAVRFHDEIVTEPSPARGVVFQQYALFPWLTVAGNVEFGLKVGRVPGAERKRIVAHYLEMMHLSAVSNAYPKELSGGMKQRVSLARAYATQPEVLLMDEPFGALDAQTKRTLQLELLRSWSDQHVTIVFITHDIEEAILVAQRILLLGGDPAHIVREFDVPLAYPRSVESMADPAFTALREELWTELGHVSHSGSQ